MLFLCGLAQPGPCEVTAVIEMEFMGVSKAQDAGEALCFRVMVPLAVCEKLSMLNSAATRASGDGSVSFGKQLFLIAQIVYPMGGRRATEDSPAGGVLIYLKAGTHDQSSNADVYSYKAAHQTFPDQTTADQFFNERQFEA
jgi:hypothetical protein